MALPEIPHFSMPFRLDPPHVAVVEQDTIVDVTDCVEAILRTTIGDRFELPTFGVDDWVFDVQPVPTVALQQSIAIQEPRAITTLEQHPDALDHLIAVIKISVAQAEEVT